MIYDYIIIGGGISGLYAAHILSPVYRVLLLEQNDYLGGRIRQEMFHQTKINLGAGFIQKSHSHIFALIKKFNIKYKIVKSFKTPILNYNFDLEKAIKMVKQLYMKLSSKKNPDLITLTFIEFLDKYFGKIFRKKYIEMSGYTDYTESDINYHVKYYTIKNDSLKPIYNIIFDWSDILMHLQTRINYKLNTSVLNVKLDSDTGLFEITTPKKLYLAKRVIFALPIKPLLTVIRNLPLNIPYNDYIGNARLLKIFTFHKDGHKFEGNNIGSYNIFGGKNLLRKIIVINDKILISSYCDESYALYWSPYLSKTKILKRMILDELRKIVPTTTPIDDIVYKYWDTGVHYFKPMQTYNIRTLIKSLQNPIPNVFVVGELCSYQQGWANGAVDSVERIRTKLFSNKNLL